MPLRAIATVTRPHFCFGTNSVVPPDASRAAGSQTPGVPTVWATRLEGLGTPWTCASCPAV